MNILSQRTNISWLYSADDKTKTQFVSLHDRSVIKDIVADVNGIWVYTKNELPFLVVGVEE